MTGDALDELCAIDNRIHTAYEAHGSDGLDLVTYVAHDYADALTADEYEQIVETVKAETLIVYPTLDKRYNRDGVSGKAFAILSGEQPVPGVDPELEPVLRFKPHQIPVPYDAADVDALADRGRNRQLIDYFDIRPWEASGTADDYAAHEPHPPQDWLDAA
jgi:hypothetical protein